MSGSARSRRWTIIFSAVLLGTTLAALGLLWGLHRPEFQSVLSHQISAYVKSKFGGRAKVGKVHVGWKTITIEDVAVPLDRNGSQLSISKAILDLSLFDLLRTPRAPLRTLKAVRANGVIVTISEPANASPTSRGSTSLSFHVPDAFYSTVRELDSLRTLQVDDASIQYEGRDTSVCVAQRLWLAVSREGSDVRISASGIYLDDPRDSLALTGELHPTLKSAETSVLAIIPSGAVPFLKRDSFWSTGGNLSARLTVQDSLATLTLSAALDSVTARSSMGSLRTGRLRITSIGDTLVLDPLDVVSHLGTAQIRGEFAIASRELAVAGHVTVDELHILRPDSMAKSAATDSITFDFRVCGPAASPTVSANSAAIRVAGLTLYNVAAEADIAPDAIVIHAVKFTHERGQAEIHGRIALDSTRQWQVAGRVSLDSALSAGEWKTRVAAAEFDAQGQAADVSAKFSLITSSGQNAGDGRISRIDSGWAIELTDADGNQATADLQASNGATRASASNAQVFLKSLFADPNNLLDPLESVSLQFYGNADGGTFGLQSSIHPDSVSILPQVLHSVQFDGSYQRKLGDTLAFLGRWSGTNGEGQPFVGQADISYLDRRCSINRLLVDSASTAAGFVDFAAGELDLEFAVVNLPFDKLPLRPQFMWRGQIAGSTTGRVHVSGKFSAPDWTAHLAVVDGAVLNVPGYWVNLDASGHGLRIDLQQFELGRDIRRIMVAQGMLDLSQNLIALTAETGSGRADDFFTALLGRSGIVSGAMDGRVAVSGQLRRPAVEAEFAIRDGFLFNSIYFTDLTAAGEVEIRSDGVPLIHVPHFELQKDTAYAFSASAEAVMHTGGSLQLRVDGHGDFLNILDQLDREFAAYGSHGELQIDIGGTVDHPRLTNGVLTVRDGRFTFPSATPSPIDADIEFRVDTTGVQSGHIDLRDGDQSLILNVRSDWAQAYPDLTPLVIPSPHISLGVLEIRSGIHGMPVRIPGLMKPEWLGDVTSGAEDMKPIVISAEDEQRWRISGDVELRNGRVTFPFAGHGGGKVRPVARWLLDRLTEAQWNLNVLVGQGNHYDVEITGLKNSELFAGLRDSPIFSTLAEYVDHLNVDAVIDPAETPLAVRGSIADSSFYLDGRLTSSRGRVEYLDQRFTIDNAVCEFDETNIMPVLEGRASTTGVDSLGRSLPVYLTMYVIDRETQIRQRRGRLDDLTFVLEDDAGDAPEDVLALLGYDVGSVSGKAQELVATSVVRAIGRQWLDPIERRLEKWTPLDEVTLNPVGGRSRNLARQQHQQVARDTLQSPSVVRFFTGSQLTVGKYLTNDVFLTYTGELAESQRTRETGRLSLVHLWNVEYRIKPLSPDLVLDFAVEYDEFERRRDESVSLKYSFALEP
jgi:hypothetical protein